MSIFYLRWSFMMRRILFLLILLSYGIALHAKPVALFYLTDTPDSIRSFLAHEKKIDLLVPPGTRSTATAW